MEKEKLTKNLKLKIKNSQLAKAAGLDKLKEKFSKIKTSADKENEKEVKDSPSNLTVAASEEQKTPIVSSQKEDDLSMAKEPIRRIRAKSRSSFVLEPKETPSSQQASADQDMSDEQSTEVIVGKDLFQEESLNQKTEDSNLSLTSENMEKSTPSESVKLDVDKPFQKGVLGKIDLGNKYASKDSVSGEKTFNRSSPDSRYKERSSYYGDKNKTFDHTKKTYSQDRPRTTTNTGSLTYDRSSYFSNKPSLGQTPVSNRSNYYSDKESPNKETTSTYDKGHKHVSYHRDTTNDKPAPSYTRTRIKPDSSSANPPKVIGRGSFGPTGQHINNILPKGYGSKSDVPAAVDIKGSLKRDPAIKSADGKPALKKDSPFKAAVKKEVKKPFDFSKDSKAKKGVEQVKSFTGRERYGLLDSDDDNKWRKRKTAKVKKNDEAQIIQRPTNIKVRLPITIKDLAGEMKYKSAELIKKMFTHGMTYVVNDIIDDETTVQFIGSEFGCDIKLDTSEQEKLQIVTQTIQEEIEQTDQSLLIHRPPVVAFMGHVDHGKTSLIDVIRKSNRVAGEAGAITQHMGAFSCHTDVGMISILDTPGHEAFHAMRARGAEVCDIAVLVIAGDEGIKEQTIEAIKHAKDASLSIVVAINKADKPGFNVENIYRQLSEQDLLPEAWGGQVITVNTSAKTGSGVKELLEMLALQSEILELKANPQSRARGLVIESELHKGLGLVATVIVQNGILRHGDSVVFNEFYGRIKTMHNDLGLSVKEAAPSTPVSITGLSGLPSAGDPFIVVKSEKIAKDIVSAREGQKRIALLQKKKSTGFDKLLENKKTLNLVIRADVQGSVEALITSIKKINSNKVDVTIVSSGIGEISESDVQLSAASKAVILGFHTSVESHAESLIKNLKVTIKLCDIIYHAVDQVKALMTELLDPIAEEKDLGSAEIKEIFKSSQLGYICGCMVLDGSISRPNKIRLKRGGEVVWKGSLSSIKRVKEDVREIKKGFECGILLNNYNLAKVGDIIEAYEITYKAQTL